MQKCKCTKRRAELKINWENNFGKTKNYFFFLNLSSICSTTNSMYLFVCSSLLRISLFNTRTLFYSFFVVFLIFVWWLQAFFTTFSISFRIKRYKNWYIFEWWSLEEKKILKRFSFLKNDNIYPNIVTKGWLCEKGPWGRQYGMQAFLLKCAKSGQWVKIIQNCVTSFVDDPSGKFVHSLRGVKLFVLPKRKGRYIQLRLRMVANAIRIILHSSSFLC